MMVRWIFALEPGKRGGNVARGLSGEINVPKDDKLQSATLEASYSDNGRGPAGSLAGKAAVKLRSRRIEAELADEKQGAKVLGKFLGAIDHGHYARCANINLRDSASVTFRVASAGQGGRHHRVGVQVQDACNALRTTHSARKVPGRLHLK
jgi:cytochrome c